MNYRVILVRHFDDGYGPRTIARANTFEEAEEIAHEHLPSTRNIGTLYVRLDTLHSESKRIS